jgi:hypothetical protein
MTDQATAPPAPAELEIREWIFTFGFGQRLHAARRADGAAGAVGAGLHLDGCYIRIRGDFTSARLEMIRLFGPVWCDQYEQLPVVPGCHWKADLTALMAGA